MSGSAFGTLVTGTLGSFVLDYFGWQAVFYTIGFLCIAWTLFLRYYVVAKDIRRAAIVTVPSKLHSSFLTKEETPVPRAVSTIILAARRDYSKGSDERTQDI
ncbi:unnamed protein product [Timema podura]|uniref:Major facilitator superfamily (MFS) profile domain-containing protein n=1 Tax=Timema podura TaxID=61482 RepID=A0ABN7NRT2_TIMPD|nr:unnamed protein product [Timema podura]